MLLCQCALCDAGTTKCVIPRSDGAGLSSFEVGLVTFLLGALRLGFMDAVLSRALLRGFITAVGFIIFIEQSSEALILPRILRSETDPVLFHSPSSRPGGPGPATPHWTGNAHRQTHLCHSACLAHTQVDGMHLDCLPHPACFRKDRQAQN